MTYQWAIKICILLGLLGCGVKGDPLPPEQPPELGRGRPTYKRATENLISPNMELEKEEDEDEEDEDQEDEE